MAEELLGLLERAKAAPKPEPPPGGGGEGRQQQQQAARGGGTPPGVVAGLGPVPAMVGAGLMGMPDASFMMVRSAAALSSPAAALSSPAACRPLLLPGAVCCRWRLLLILPLLPLAQCRSCCYR